MDRKYFYDKNNVKSIAMVDDNDCSSNNNDHKV